MAEFDDLRLAELLCARLCHDLASPIGGAAAGIELLSDSDQPDADDVRLLADSIATAAAHLKFLRAALGHGTTPFVAGELKALAHGLLIGRGTVALDWDEPDGDGCPRQLGKLALTLFMVGLDALPRGGRLQVHLQTAAAQVEMLATGLTMAIDELLAGFSDPASAPGPRGAPALYATRLAAAQGAALAVERRDGQLRLTARRR